MNISLPTLMLAALALLAQGRQARADDPWTLERALAHALENNPDARVAERRIATAQAGLDQAKSAFWPKFKFQSSQTRTTNPMQAFGGILSQRAYDPALDFNNLPQTDNFNGRVVVALPLYAGGLNVANRTAAAADASAARQMSVATRNRLAFEVVRTFHEVLKTRMFMRASEAAVVSFEAQLEVAAKRLEAGALLKSEFLDIEVGLAAAKEEDLNARNANDLALGALRNLLGVEGPEIDIVDQAPEIAIPDTGDVSEHPEMAAARDRVRAAEARLRASKSGHLPHVSAFGSADYDYGWGTFQSGDSYSVGVALQWDIWDGFSTRSKIRGAASELEASREERRKMALDLNYEAHRARLRLEAADGRLEVTRKSVEQAAESARLTKARFEQGLALASQLIDAETALLGVRVRRAEAEADRQVAIAALRKALALPQFEVMANAK